MRRVLFIVGWAVAGALVWAIIFGFALLLGSDDPDDFFEQATFRTEKVVAVAGASVADGPCGESKDGKGTTHTHGTSYEVDLTWTDADGDTRHGVMSTCNRRDEGEHVTVWVSSHNAVFNRSPFAMYSSVPIAAGLFALGAWGWTWLTKDERRGSETLRQRLRRYRLRRLRLRELRRAKRN
ncbi:hypothetical protein EV649_0433 [Kribbella sp. VKM Ac-2569]|uniref:hypothetical protein n=1 Tax=Kribbella sp. VKM Ac-2569 TaxID=2512220 RepID=UPI00102B3C40|nr:hypothetical protein [Kribbella sp. VKM Ac-2569]RZT26686.1 hypothetical protein EV649_0433 [Kribbella sp. VKM Ac-2569]